MEENNNKKQRKLFIAGLVALLVMVIGATYAYFAVTTVNNFGTSTINATAGPIGSVTLNGNNAQLNLSITALDMVQGNSDVTYYAGTSGKTTTPTTVTLGTASVTPNTDTNTYHCTYTLSVTHTGTNDMYTVFTSGANKSTEQLILTINGVDYDFYDGWPTNNQVQGEFYIKGNQTKNVTAGLRLINDSDINQNYLANTDIQISISLVNNSLSCTAVESLLARIGTDSTTGLSLVRVGTDEFYDITSAINYTSLISASGNVYNYAADKTILLAKYPLKPDGNNSYEQDSSGLFDDLALSDFSNDGYWHSIVSPTGLLSQYANTANVAGKTGTYSSPYPYVYDSNSNVYPYVNSYANKLANMTGVTVIGRLLSREEASNLDTEVVKYNNEEHYWLGSAYARNNVWYVQPDTGNFSYAYCTTDEFYDQDMAIRPVIVVNTSDIS